MKGVIDDNMSNDPRTPEDAIRKDGKQTDKAKDRKNELVDDNMISDDNVKIGRME